MVTFFTDFYFFSVVEFYFDFFNTFYLPAKYFCLIVMTVFSIQSLYLFSLATLKPLPAKSNAGDILRSISIGFF